ncbi:MAG: phosphoenolpyruvate-utilizing N-terminal domain-containing protein [Polyangiaceae bacterium]
MNETGSTRTRVHGYGDKRLDAVLDFVAFAARPMPLVTLLDEAPRRLAAIVGADVCSLYLLEGDGNTLVMRGNVGFGRGVLGQVRLSVGEGITGQAFEYMRPISAKSAGTHTAYKHFETLGEERFPVFLAVPMRGKSGPLGALVVQRKELEFDDRDVELVTTLSALIAAGIRHAELLDSRRDRAASSRRTGGGTRKVTLTGRPVVAGRALGAIAPFRRPPPRPKEQSTEPQQVDADVRRLRGAFDTADKAIRSLAARAEDMELGDEANFLRTYTEILADMRFRERATELVATGMGVSHALGQVARLATRTAASVTRDPFLEERARDLEDLCDALVMLSSTEKRAELPSKGILVGDGLTVFDLLVSARAHPVAVALTDRASGPRTRVLLSLLGVPSIVDVQGLFRWASDGDIALLDADHGLLILNPTKSEMAALREFRRSIPPPGSAT